MELFNEKLFEAIKHVLKEHSGCIYSEDGRVCIQDAHGNTLVLSSAETFESMDKYTNEPKKIISQIGGMD